MFMINQFYVRHRVDVFPLSTRWNCSQPHWTDRLPQVDASSQSTARKMSLLRCRMAISHR